jgi:hypothetical protein
MLIARQKRSENIAEYLLYMFQVEDLIRAYDFNLDQIIDQYVRPQLPDASFVEQYRDWYRGLIRSMKAERIEKQGHLHDLKDILVEISYLHNTLLNLLKDEKYAGLYAAAEPIIEEFKQRSNLKDKNNIEVAFQALYMKLLLRLQKKEISAESEHAFDTMRILLAYIAVKYREMQNGELNTFGTN